MTPNWIAAGVTITLVWSLAIFLSTRKFRTLVCRYRGHRWLDYMETPQAVVFVRTYCEYCGLQKSLEVVKPTTSPFTEEDD